MTTQNDLGVELLDLDMSSVADLAGFELPPEGRYLCNLSLSTKDVNGVNSVEFNYKVVEAIELVDPEAVVKPNASFSSATGITAERLPFIKVKCGILAEALGIPANLKSLIENVQNLQVELTLKHRRGKAKSADDDIPVYADVKDKGFSVVS